MGQNRHVGPNGLAASLDDEMASHLRWGLIGPLGCREENSIAGQARIRSEQPYFSYPRRGNLAGLPRFGAWPLRLSLPVLLCPQLSRSRVGKGRPAGSIELRVSPSPSKIPYGGFSPVRLQMDRQQRPSTKSRGLSAVHIRPMTPSYTPPQLSLPGVRDPRRDYPF